MIDRKFWKKRRVLLTGHTGFKGSWLSLWLSDMGASISGLSLDPSTSPSLFHQAEIADLLTHDFRSDIRDLNSVQASVNKSDPEIVFHLAAQPIVRKSYDDPVGTFETNIMGTVNILEACRLTPSVRSVVIVTTDKCYENSEWYWGYRENDPLGGHDPYSASKAATEIVVSSYRRSFYSVKGNSRDETIRIASARAGNVIGGGDWAESRLMPDVIRSLSRKDKIILRNPDSIRPWQHVLDPLSGYLLLAQRLYGGDSRFTDSWNFGPESYNTRTVRDVVNYSCRIWGTPSSEIIVKKENMKHEAGILSLDISKAKHVLGWEPIWDFAKSIEKTVTWYKSASQENFSQYTLMQINEYEHDLVSRERAVMGKL